MTGKIPVTILTGFLGAGKTTLIRHILENANGRRLAVIVNEFGDVGIDGTILKACGAAICPEDSIVELANGCLCCTVADDFVPALDSLLNRPEPPEHILIETSGLALPKPLLKAFGWPEIRTRVTVDGVVTVIDGPAVAAGRFADNPARVAAARTADPTVDHDNPLEEVYRDQLLAADLAVLNKTDLMDAAAAAAVADGIRRTVPRAVKIVTARNGKPPVDVLLGLSAAAERDLALRPSHHDGEGEHDHDDFESFAVAIPPVASPMDLAVRANLAAAGHGVLRIKGFAAVSGKPMRLLLQGVGQRAETSYGPPWKPGEDRRGLLTVIGQKGLNREEIVRILCGEDREEDGS